MTNATTKERTRTNLLKKYPVGMTGIWIVKGEDSNADFGGSHYMPTLGYYEGIYADIVDYAVSLDRFFTWGGGGSIEPIEVQPVERSTIRELEETVAELAELESKKKVLTKKLEKLGNPRSR